MNALLIGLGIVAGMVLALWWGVQLLVWWLFREVDSLKAGRRVNSLSSPCLAAEDQRRNNGVWGERNGAIGRPS